VPIADKVSYVGNNALANFAASQTGVLVYTASDLSQAELTWFDRSGKILGTVGAPGELEFISLSPDDTAVVAVRSESQNGTSDLWRHDFARHVDTRLTFTGANRFPSWSPDGAHIAYSGARNGSRSLYQIAANGAGQEELLEAGPKLPADWSRDGRYLITMTTSQNPKTGNDIWVLPLLGDRKPFPYLQTEFAEFFARLSPDGKWLAYTSNESGHEDVYVVGFPGHTGKWQISTTGGSRPVWSRDNRELYFLDADRKIAAVEIKSGATFQAGAPKSLFEVRFPRGNTNFAVTKDGRFLIPALVQESDIPVTVVFNWTGLLSK
jgi:eukaryotic-like serine/threonine-protein kinase